MKQLVKYSLLSLLLVVALVMAGCTPAQPTKETAPGKVAEEREAGLVDAGEEVVEEVIDPTKEELLKELAGLEKDWTLDKLHEIVIKCDEITDQWIYTDYLYNRYILELFEVKKEFDKYYNEVKGVYEEKDFASQLKDEPLYRNRLARGQMMRDTVKEFFDVMFEGVRDDKGNMIDISGKALEDFYQEKMVEEYNEHYRRLSPALR